MKLHVFPPLVFSVLLTACAHTSPTPAKTDLETKKSDSTPLHQPSTSQTAVTSYHQPSLLEFAFDFSEMTPETQKKELTQIQDKISAHRDELHHKVKAAMIYSIPGSRLRDSSKAQPLLDELTREKRLNSEEKMMVAILREYALEASKLSQRIRDEQKRTEENQQKADALQQKLDELKKIERTMMQKSLKELSRGSGK
ncbi:hypothetical protein LG201_01515 [Methylobacillus gramineus]|uniref:hypothetical protein n=1 Tax=Methylobacillus gramineus TaxID=755169 RepID=UPI001D0013D9|nr:hypothetical protein [Methylobacillus gramineus]MCB5183879.1 hypothetical protein [Methylobacillus gramineus]